MKLRTKSNGNGPDSPERGNTNRELEVRITELEGRIAGLKELRDMLFAQLEDCKRDRDAWRSQAEAVALLTDQRPRKRWWGQKRPANKPSP
jgi:hypothetical protein